MSEPLDDLYARWQRSPDPGLTAALCDAVRSSGRLELVDIVGPHASREQDARALVAAARMYGSAGRFDQAQSTLVAAGRLAPRDGSVFRFLGEILLRKGDAERAEKVLERAVQLGSPDGSGAAWLERARARVSAQRTVGVDAVAVEVAHSFPEERARIPDAEESLDDVETQVRRNDDVRAALSPMGSWARPPVPAAGLPRVSPPPAHPPYGQTKGVDLAPGLAPGAAAPVSAPATSPFGATVSAGMPPSSARFVAPAPPPASSPMLPTAPWSADHAARGAPAPTHMPEARDVLEALQVAGIYEPAGTSPPDAGAWARAEKGRRRVGSFVTLIAMAVLFTAGAGGTFVYIKDRRGKQHVVSEQILARVDKDLRAGALSSLDPSEKAIAQAFDLESRSPHAALTWLRERGLRGLLLGGEDVAFEDATSRAKEVGTPEAQVAFASVASYLFQNDTAGAAATLARWDATAQGDPFYQLFAGATFERAGDPRALERYEAAAKLDPELFVARMLFARATAVDGEPAQAALIAKELRELYPNRPETAALVALAWARDPRRGSVPDELKVVAGQEAVLPRPLKAVPHAARAILALEEHKLEEAKPELAKALSQADTPGMATWIGSIALSTGDEALARRAALSAVSYSALYAPARVLAARVALLGARLDEALKATEELPPTSADVAVVAAVVAYERIDGERLDRALSALSDGARKLPFVAAATRGNALLLGKPAGALGDKLTAQATEDAPWADLVAMDEALDTGDLTSAAKLASTWATDERPLRAARLARLARYQGKTDDAEKASRVAFEGAPTPRTFAERVFSLVAAGKAESAVALFKTHPNAGGPLTRWLRAYALASSGKVEEARAILAQEDPPPALTPAPLRLVAAMAYGATKDTRHGADVVKTLAQSGLSNPDLVEAGTKVGVRVAGGGGGVKRKPR